jgi:putative hydrolase
VADLAAAHQVFLEITTRRGHSLTNAHVAKIAGASGALMLLNSDSHCEDDLLSEDMAKDVLRKAGVGSRKFKQILEFNPLQLLQRIRRLP